MTYAELKAQLNMLNAEQLQMTVQLEDAYEDDCHPATHFYIANREHPNVVEDHPVIRF